MQHSLGAAVIGTGFAGAQHVEALRRIGVPVRVLVGSEEGRARGAADRLGVERSGADVQAAIGDPEVDVVHVCVPNALHVPIVRAALDAGKHLVCEKPLATTAADALELARVARSASGRSVLCHNYRFYPMAAEMRARVARGDIGRPHLVRGGYLQDWLLAPDATSWRVDPAAGGPSRAVADIGTHWIDLAETVVGRHVEAVMAWIGTVHDRRPDPRHVESFGRAAGGELVEVHTEDQAAVLLRFGGAMGSATFSQVAAGHRNDLSLAIDGEGGSLEWRQERPDELRMATLGGPRQILDRDPNALTPGAASLARLPAGHGEGWADGLRNLLSEAYAEIDGRRGSDAEEAVPLPTFDDGARHLAFVEAVLRSQATGEWVTIGDITGDRPAERQPAEEVSS